VEVDEYGEIAKRWGSELREGILEPSIKSSGGWIDYAGTPKGSNDFSYIHSLARKNKDWWSSLKTVEDTGLYTAQEIAEIKANAVNEDLFYQEYYCRVVEGANSVFKNIEKAVQGALEKPVRGERYIFGIDLARTLDSTAIVGFNSKNHLVYYEKLTNQSWETQKFKIKQALWAYNNAEAVIDATGVGDSFVESLMVNDQLRLIPLKIQNNVIKRNLVEKLAAYIENRHITYPHIADLLDELGNYEYKISSQNKILYSAPSGKHDDIVMALALAVSRLQPRAQEGIIYETHTIQTDPRTGYIQ
jgi:phage FluMu gp28-like protein